MRDAPKTRLQFGAGQGLFRKARRREASELLFYWYFVSQCLLRFRHVDLAEVNARFDKPFFHSVPHTIHPHRARQSPSVTLHMIQARRLVSSIAHLPNAVGSVVGSQAAPAKLITAACGLSARHVITSIIFLNALSTVGTFFDALAVVERLEQRNLLVLVSVLIVLRTCAVLVPLTPVSETGLASAFEALHDGFRILVSM